MVTIQSNPSRSNCTSIRSTGNGKFLKKVLRKRSTGDELMKNTFVSTTQCNDRLDESTMQKGKDVILMCFNTYILLRENKQVVFDSGFRNPCNCMKVLHYDAFPVFLEGDKCLIMIEVSVLIYLNYP